MHEFAIWLSGTPVSLVIQTVEWIIPAIQSLHILAIGFATGAVAMLCGSTLGWFGRTWPPMDVSQNFRPWLLLSIAVLATTGILLIIGEPVRELMSISFWVKMVGLAIGLTGALYMAGRMRAEVEPGRLALRPLAWSVVGVWCAIIFLGRFIAYDASIWGALSPQAF